MHRPLRLAAMAIVVGLIAAACSSSNGSDSSLDVGSAGDPAPDVTFQMADGSTARLSEFRDQPVVLNFFASWCAPCRAEMPDFEEVHQETAGAVRFLGLAMQDTTRAAAALIEETGVTYDWGLDPRGSIYADFRGFSMPTTIYISADGTVVGRDNGPINARALRDRIERFFGVSVP